MRLHCLSVRLYVSAITLDRTDLRSPNLVYMTYGTIVRPSSKMRSLGQVLKGPAIRVHIKTLTPIGAP
jgi:hypothetical protein